MATHHKRSNQTQVSTQIHFSCKQLNFLINEDGLENFTYAYNQFRALWKKSPITTTAINRYRYGHTRYETGLPKHISLFINRLVKHRIGK